jgi:hypothetical protein
MANSHYLHVYIIGLEDKIVHVAWCLNYQWLYMTENFGDTKGSPVCYQSFHVRLLLIQKALPH